MQGLVDDAVMASPLVERTAAAIAADAPQGDFTAQLRNLYNFIAQRVRFRKDTFPTEHLRHPDQLLGMIREHGMTSADCDDGTMLAAALARSLGWPAFFVVVGRRADGPLEHVLPAVAVQGVVLRMDPQHRRPPGTVPTYPRELIAPAQEQSP